MKYYQINPNVIFRNYDDFGYITDNRNFGYHFTNASYVLGDRIVSESAAIILSCLEKSPLSINEIANKAMKEFIDVNENQLKSDTETLLQTLTKDGFIITGDSKDECRKNAHNFIQYNIIDQPTKEYASKNSLSTTQTFLEQRFGDKPFPVSVHIDIISVTNVVFIVIFLMNIKIK